MTDSEDGESIEGHNAQEVQSEDDVDRKLEKPKLCCSARLILCMACFVAILSMVYVRVRIAMAFICMTAPVLKPDEGKVSREGEFEWSSTLRGYLTSAIFYGFLVGPIVAGVLSFKFGGKMILVIGTFMTGATNFLIPEATRLTPILLFILRVIVGFFSSFVYPAFYELMSHWIVPEETQLLVTGALLGMPMGNILNYPVSTLICQWLGWVWLFYIVGIWLVVWGIIYFFVIYEYPETCVYISEEELRFLSARIPRPGKHKIPWKYILKSMPVYAYILMHFCMNYVHISMVVSIPALMIVHNFSMTENGFLSAIPFVGSFVLRLLLSIFFEPVRMKLKMTKNTLRKISLFLGAFLASTSLFVSTLLSSGYRYWVLGCLVISTTSLELCLTGGYLLSILDLCPSYANVVSGLANTIGNTAGLIGPVINGLITPDGSRENWNIVLYLNIALLSAATAFYLVFGQNSLLQWGLAKTPEVSELTDLGQQ